MVWQHTHSVHQVKVLNSSLKVKIRSVSTTSRANACHQIVPSLRLDGVLNSRDVKHCLHESGISMVAHPVAEITTHRGDRSLIVLKNLIDYFSSDTILNKRFANETVVKSV
jgi:hypothetical protein